MSAARQPPAPPAAPKLVSLARVGLETLLGRGIVRVTVASGYPTGVPDRVRAGAPVYALDIAWQMSPPIGLELHDGGFTARLSFGGQLHDVAVPYAAVLAAEVREVGAQVAPPTKHTRPNHLKLV